MRKAKTLLAVLLCLTLLLSLFPGKVAKAAEVYDSDFMHVTEFISNDTLQPNSGGNVNWLVGIIFEVQPEPNQTFTVSFPKNTNIWGDTTEEPSLAPFTIKGEEVASVKYDKLTNTATYTFNENIKKHSHVRFRAKYPVFADREKLKDDLEILPLVFKVNDKTFDHYVKLDYQFREGENGGVISISQQNPEDPYHIIGILADTNNAEQTFKYVAVINPYAEQVPANTAWLFGTSNKEEIPNIVQGDSDSPWVMDNIKLYRPKNGVRLRHSMHMDLENDYDKIQEFTADQLATNPTVVQNQFARSFDYPVVFVIEGHNKLKDKSPLYINGLVGASNLSSYAVLQTGQRFDSSDASGSSTEAYSIGDRVWIDENGNGIQDDGEKGIPGVPVTLVMKNVILDVDITDENGEYIFEDVWKNAPDTNYTVRINIPQGYQLSPAEQGSDREKDSNPNESAVTVVDKNITDVDFGLVPIPKGRLVEKHHYYILPKGTDENSYDYTTNQPDLVFSEEEEGYAKDKWNVEPKEYEDYKLVKVETENFTDNTPSKEAPKQTGNFIDGKTLEVRYIYVKHYDLGKVVINHKYYTSKDGEVATIADLEQPDFSFSNEGSGDENFTYHTSPFNIQGYTLKEVQTEGTLENKITTEQPDQTNHFVEGETHKITYVYVKPETVVTPETGNVVVRHLIQGTEDELAADEQLKTNEAVGTSYQASPKVSGTEEFDKDGVKYRLVGLSRKTEAPEKGQVVPGTIHVIYEYAPVPAPEAPKTGTVKVRHLDKATMQPIVPDAYAIAGEGEAKNVAVGTEYTSAPKVTGDQTIGNEDGTKTYVYAGMSETSTTPANGQVVEGEKEVIYLYTEKVEPTPEVKKGSVKVRHIVRGTQTDIVQPSYVQKDQPVGTAYQTQPLVTGDNTVTGETPDTTGKKYVYYGVADETELAPNGTVQEGEKTVIYTYVEVKEPVVPEKETGSVVVRHVVKGTDTDIEDPTELVKDQEVGTLYQSKPLVEGEAQHTSTKDGKKYVLVGISLKSDGGKNGVVTKGVTTVIYEYQEVKDTDPEKPDPVEERGTVVVRHINKTTGEPLKADETVKDNELVGTEYSTTSLVDQTTGTYEKDGKSYRLVGVKGNPEGRVQKGSTTIVYEYVEVTVTPDPTVEKGSVVVRHLDEEGNALVEDKTVVNEAEVGTDYTTKSLIGEDGYYHNGEKTYKLVEVDGNPTGKVTTGTTTITYHYKEVKDAGTDPEPSPEEKKKGSVVVRHVVKGTDQDIVPQDTVFNLVDVDTEYATKPLVSGEDTFKKGEDNYRLSGLSLKSAAASGKVQEGTIVVIYEYVKVGNTEPTDPTKPTEPTKPTDPTKPTNPTEPGKPTKPNEPTLPVVPGNPVEGKGTIVVIHIDENGNNIVPPSILKNKVPTGEPYEAESLVPNNGTYKVNGKVYKLVGLDKNSIPAQGEVTDGVNYVIYRYEEVKQGAESNVSKVSRDTNKGSLPRTGESYTAMALILVLLTISLTAAVIRRKREA